MKESKVLGTRKHLCEPKSLMFDVFLMLKCTEIRSNAIMRTKN